MKKFILLLVMGLMACSSAELVENWKNPDIVLFDADKVLIVGVTQNKDARESYETRLYNEFKRRGIGAMRSIDVFDVAFTTSEKSDQELADMEQRLLDKDFDAILLTKVVGIETIEHYDPTRSPGSSYYQGFEEDYLHHQEVYYNPEYYDNYSVYHAETSLYCICVDKERELIWRGSIDITDPVDVKKTIEDYVKLVVLAMEDQDLIFRKEAKNKADKSESIL